MSETQKESEQVNQEVSADATTEAIEQKKVDYDTYRKAVATEKKAKAERNQLAKELEEIKAKLEAKAPADDKISSNEAIEKMRKDLMEAQKKLNDTRLNNAKNAFKTSFFEVAQKMGCTAPDKLLRLSNPDDIKSAVESVNLDDPSFDKDELEYLVSKAKNENPEFFKSEQKTFPKVENKSSFSIEKMSIEDKIKFLVSK